MFGWFVIIVVAAYFILKPTIKYGPAITVHAECIDMKFEERYKTGAYHITMDNGSGTATPLTQVSSREKLIFLDDNNNKIVV